MTKSVDSADPKTPDQPSVKVDLFAIDDVLIDQGNVRDHDERNISTIAGSLKQFGSGRSIVLDGENVVKAGNGTVTAARRVGFKEVIIVDPKPDQLVAVRRSDWSPTEATGYSIVDNRSSDLSRFNLENLSAQLKTLKENGLHNSVMGWTDEEMTLMLEQKNEEEETSEISKEDGEGLAKIADVVRPEPITKAKLGDCFMLGLNLLFCIDVLVGWPFYFSSLKEGDVFVPYPSPLVPLGITNLGKRYVMVQPNLYLCSMTVDLWNAAHPEDPGYLMKEIKVTANDKSS